MKIELKWLPNGRKTPALQQVHTYAELELLVVKDLDIGDGVFYITEGGHIVAEAKRTV